MEFFKLSKSWANSRNIPKEALYSAMGADEKLKRIFVENVERVRLEYLITANNSNIEAYIEENQKYEEIHFYKIELRQKGREEKVVKLLHGIVPKGTIIEVCFEDEVLISSVVKDISSNSLKIVETYNTDWLEKEDEILKSFDSSNYNTRNLKEFYNSIIDRIKAYKASKIIGEFNLENADENSKKAEKILELQEKIDSLKKELKKEKHGFKKSEIVKKIKKLNAELEKLK